MHTRFPVRSACTAALLSAVCVAPAHALTLLPGSSGVIAFGASPYGGAPNAGLPTYIGNNFTGLNDVLSSPGGGTLGGYLTANPVVGNNVFSVGPVGLPMTWTQVGGASPGGLLGAGAIAITPTTVSFGLVDVNPGGGTASYGIGTWSANYQQQVAPYIGSIGNWLGIAGNVPFINNAAVASLYTRVSSLALGVIEFKAVLAASNNGVAGYNLVGKASHGAGLTVANLGSYRGLAVNSLNVMIPVNDVVSVTNTLTIYADPASVEGLSLANLMDLMAAPEFAGVALPDLPLGGSGTALPVPEPATYATLLAGLFLIGAIARSRRQRR